MFLNHTSNRWHLDTHRKPTVEFLGKENTVLPQRQQNSSHMFVWLQSQHWVKLDRQALLRQQDFFCCLAIRLSPEAQQHTSLRNEPASGLKVPMKGFHTIGNGAGSEEWSTGPQLSRTVSLKNWQNKAHRGQVLPYKHEVILSATTVCKCWFLELWLLAKWLGFSQEWVTGKKEELHSIPSTTVFLLKHDLLKQRLSSE